MKNKKSKTSKHGQTAAERLGIKGLSRGQRRKLEAYQHLFYLLQVLQNNSTLRFIADISWNDLRFFLLKFDTQRVTELTSLPVYVDKPVISRQADLSDAPKQVNQVYGHCYLYFVQLCLQPEGGISTPQTIQDFSGGGNQVRSVFFQCLLAERDYREVRAYQTITLKITNSDNKL